MRKIICFILLGMNFLTGYSQTEWKFVGGIDLTPVLTTGRPPYRYGYNSNNDYYYTSGSIDRTTTNQGSIGVSLDIKAKKVLFELGVSGGNYTKESIVRTALHTYNHFNGQETITGDTTFSSTTYFLPCGRVSLGYSITPKFATRLFVGNFGNVSLMTGISLDKRFGKHWGASVCGYLPMQMSAVSEPVQKKHGLGFRLNYSFAQREKSKKSNSIPTVL